MEDLVSLLLFAAIFIFTLMKSSKKKVQGQRPVRRPVQRPARREAPVAARPRPAVPDAGGTRAPEAGAAPGEIVEGLLDLLRGRIPLELEPQRAKVAPQPVMDDEARSLESTEPDRDREHQEFHETVEATSVPAAVTPRRRSRYRLTPKTARDAVVWTAIFTKPKGLE